MMKGKLRLLILMAIGLLMFFNMTQAFGAENAAKQDVKYTFTSDWFTHDIPSWTIILNDMKGKPNLTYLEVGVYEGRSFLWVMDNILTHPSSKAIAIDTFDKIFDSDPEKVFLENLRRSGHSSQVKVLKGFSQEKLRQLTLNSVDLIYIDGDHRSKGVIMDAILSWDLLKEGGILMFDDYKLDYGLPMDMRPEYAIDVFLSLFPDEFQILVNDYQMILRKNKSQCIEAMGFIKRLEMPLVCSRLGPYVYYWKPQKLYEASTYREIALSKKDIPIIENTLMSRKLGFRLEVDKKETDNYRNLLNRLGLQDIGISSKEK
ncbi:MAG: class I SAM-dependent methyltransferase [Syntrophales bacterium]